MYCAPEVLTNFSEAPYDAKAADVWSCGVVLFIMLFGRHPYARDEDKALPAHQQVTVPITELRCRNKGRKLAAFACQMPRSCMKLIAPSRQLGPQHFLQPLPPHHRLRDHLWSTAAYPSAPVASQSTG